MLISFNFEKNVKEFNKAAFEGLYMVARGTT